MAGVVCSLVTAGSCRPQLHAQKAANKATCPAVCARKAHLVLHERDERRDDDADLVRERRQNLVADALAGPGGHDNQGVEAIQGALDDILASKADFRSTLCGPAGDGHAGEMHSMHINCGASGHDACATQDDAGHPQQASLGTSCPWRKAL